MVVKTDEAGNVKPDKAKSAEKIDGAVALKGGGERQGSIYDYRELIVIQKNLKLEEHIMPQGMWKQCKIPGCARTNTARQILRKARSFRGAG